MDLAPSSKLLDRYTACPDCDLLLYNKRPPPGYTLLCPRCGRAISRGTAAAFAKVLALALSGLLLYPPAMLLPLMTLNSLPHVCHCAAGCRGPTARHSTCAPSCRASGS